MQQLAILDAAPGAAWICSTGCTSGQPRSLEVTGRFAGPWAETVLTEASSALEVIPLTGEGGGVQGSRASLERLELVCEQMRLHEAHRQRSWHWELSCLHCDTSAALLPGSTPQRLGVETPRPGRTWERSAHRVAEGAQLPAPGLGASLGEVRTALERVFGTALALEGGAVRQRSQLPRLWCGVGRGRGEGAVSYTDWVLTDGRCTLISPEGVALPYVPGDPVECYLGEGEAEVEGVRGGYALTCAVEVSAASFALQVRETRHGEESTQLLQQLIAREEEGLLEGVRALRGALGGL